MTFNHCLLVLLSTLIACTLASENIVTIANGQVNGIVYDTARAFYGIPYAAPPVGNLRWSAPQEPQSWTTPLNATWYKPNCPQLCDLPPLCCPFQVSEDCLVLDVYTPRLDTIVTPRPVMVFFPGGRFEQGGSSTPLYNGDFLANRTQVIVVIVNYRLGALGWLADDAISGNFGFLDQQAALRWVQSNIAAFGGNNSQVTIFGQSAGGTSVFTHMTSPSSWGLFQSAIMESNPIQLRLKTMKQMKYLAHRFAEDLGCRPNDLKCLRSQNVSAILEAQHSSQTFLNPLMPLAAFYPWTPVVDGTVVPEQPWDATLAGKFNKVPFILGTVEDEGVMFIDSAFPNPMDTLEYNAFIDVVFTKNATKVKEMYPIPPYEAKDTRPVVSVMGTDYIWVCPTRYTARAMADITPTFLYHFNHVLDFNPWGPLYTECITAACHGSELPFVFGSTPLGGFAWGPGEYELSEIMATYWGNFATSGNPNHPYPVLQQWPQYQAASNIDMEFSIPTKPFVGYLNSICNDWDALGYDYGDD